MSVAFCNKGSQSAVDALPAGHLKVSEYPRVPAWACSQCDVEELLSACLKSNHKPHCLRKVFFAATRVECTQLIKECLEANVDCEEDGHGQEPRSVAINESFCIRNRIGPTGYPSDPAVFESFLRLAFS